MIPDDFIKRVSTQKYIDAGALLKSLEEPSPVSIRINTSKWNKTPRDPNPVPWCRNGHYLEKRPSFTLDPLFHSGCYYPQEASGMFLEQVFRQITPYLPRNLRVLDLCAAPGGKSTHISEIIGSNGLLVANDAIRSRAAILAETLTKWGSGNCIVTQNDPAAFGRLSGYFDIIMIDAPCSGEGMFRSEIALNEWSLNNTTHCAERQKRILTDVWPALKENGILIYSTCTFNPGENEENLKWFLGKKEADCIRIDVSEFKGIVKIEFKGIFGYGFYQDKIRGEGFFISALRKTGKPETNPIRRQKNSDLRPSGKNLDVVVNWTQFSKDRIIKWSDGLLAVPCGMDEYLHLYSKLKILKAGIKVSTVRDNKYLPSHELALSTGILKHAFPENEINLAEALSFMRRDNFLLKNTLKGWNILTYNGINLGFVNNIGTRLNNYFPVQWRIRMRLPLPGTETRIEWD